MAPALPLRSFAPAISLLVATFVLLTGLSGTAEAVSIGLHAVPAAGIEPDCASAPNSYGCGWRTSGLNVSAPLNELTDVYVVALSTDLQAGFSAAGFSIDYSATSGLQILDWASCADQVTIDSGWPAPGGRMTVRFDPGNCQGTVADTALYSEGGFVVLAVLRVLATAGDTLQIDAYEGEAENGTFWVEYCDGTVVDLPLSLGTAGEIGFGISWYWDPCNSIGTYDHLCWVFQGSSCSCCLPDDVCRPITWYFDHRGCREASGQPLEAANCADCAVPTLITTWGSIKAVHR